MEGINVMMPMIKTVVLKLFNGAQIAWALVCNNSLDLLAHYLKKALQSIINRFLILAQYDCKSVNLNLPKMIEPSKEYNFIVLFNIGFLDEIKSCIYC